MQIFLVERCTSKGAQLEAIRWYTLLEGHVDFRDPIRNGYEEQETGLTPQILKVPLPYDFPYIPM